MSQSESPVSVTAERFLREVIARIPLERIEELHLFSPLRQGTVETGIAVVAALVVVPPASTPGAAEPELSLAAGAPIAFLERADVIEAAEAGEGTEATEVAEAGAGAASREVAEAGEGTEATEVAEAGEAVAIGEAVEPIARHTVYTARYRHVIKGPDRGKWEADVKAEADAPLVTVETVVRGVQRRAGEESEIVRYTAQQLARVLRVGTPA